MTTTYKRKHQLSSEDEDSSCSSIVQTCIYVLAFLLFAAGLCWLVLTGKGPFERPKNIQSASARLCLILVAGCLLTFLATIYVYVRCCQLYADYEEKTSYLPILRNYVLSGTVGYLAVYAWAYIMIFLLIRSLRGISKFGLAVMECTFFGGAVPEEILKYCVFVLGYGWSKMSPDSDFILRMMVLQATAAGLGFGTMEAFQYVAKAWGGGPPAVIRMSITRTLVVPVHGMWAYISGCSYLIALLEGEIGCSIFFSSIWRSVCLHAISNVGLVILAIIMGVWTESVAAVRLSSYAYLIVETIITFYICRARFRTLKEKFADVSTDEYSVDAESGVIQRRLTDPTEGRQWRP